MSASEVAIVVHYQAMEGKGDEVAALLARHTAATRAEPGCLDFVALRGTEDPDSFMLYERYADRAAFEAHTASPHYEGIAVAQIRPLLADRTVEFCQVIEPDGDTVRLNEDPSVLAAITTKTDEGSGIRTGRRATRRRSDRPAWRAGWAAGRRWS